MNYAVDYSREATIACPMCNFSNYEAVTRRFDSGPVVRCRQCEHVYLNPPPPSDFLVAVNEEAHTANVDKDLIDLLTGYFNEPGGYCQRALEFTEASGGLSGKNVLEVGSGPGIFLNECRKRGAKITGVDMSRNSSPVAQRNFGFSILTKPLNKAIAEGDLKFGSFDWIFAFEVIEHVPKPKEFVQEIQRLLKPGGNAVFSTPNFFLYYSMGDAAPAMRSIVDHVHFFEPKTLKACMEAAGLTIVSLESLNGIPAGDQQKKKMAHNPLINRIWRAVRQLPFVRTLKDLIIGKMNQTTPKPLESAPFTGQSLICHARRSP